MKINRGTCLCYCGGDVVGQNNTTLESHGDKLISCKRCYKVWDADYAFSVRPKTGVLELDIDDQDNFRRKKKKDIFL